MILRKYFLPSAFLVLIHNWTSSASLHPRFHSPEAKEMIPTIDASGNVEYYRGDLPLILTCSHGHKYAGIRNRTAGCWDGHKCIFTHDCGQIDLER